MANPTTSPRRRRVGIYDRPRSADVNWVRWLVWLVAILIAAVLLYRMLA